MRHATACRQCRQAKRRCTVRPGVLACLQCALKNGTCSLDEPSARRSNYARGELSSFDRTLPDQSHGPFELSDVLSSEEVTHLVQIYIDLIHDRPHSLFHVHTLWQEIDSGSIHPPLLSSLCAFGARISPRPDLREKATTLMTVARLSLQHTLEDISLATVQTCILFANLCAADLAPTLETLYFGIANRIAIILNLNVIDSADEPLTREIKCRVWWALVMADSWCSAGLRLPRQLYLLCDSMPYPGDELEFQHMRAPSDLARRSELGIWGYMVQLVSLFGSICELNRRLIDVTGSYELDMDDVLVLEQQLDSWANNLPQSLKDTRSNLSAHRVRGTGGCFVALHLGYYHYSSLLLFRFLSNGSSVYAHRLSEKCRLQAGKFSQLLQQARMWTGCEAIYATVGHMALVSSSVLLHALLFGQKEQLAETKADLVANFQALLELKVYWPCLTRTMRRLLLFQQFCLRTNSRDTHSVDEWMLTFLVHHAIPLDERFVPDDIASTTTYIDKAPYLHMPGRENAVHSALAFLREGTAVD